MKSEIQLTFENCKRENRPALLTYTVASDPNGLIDGISVDTVGYFSLEGASANTGAPLKATGGTKSFESQSGVVIIAQTDDVAIASGDDLAGYLVYTID